MLIASNLLLFTLSNLFVNGLTQNVNLPMPCDGPRSEIFCHGRLLDTVQMSRIYQDSKTFVDMKLRQPVNETLELFDQFMTKHSNEPSREQILEWVETYFDKPGSEFENWIPDDFTKNPQVFDKIKDKNLQEFARDLNGIWLELGRKMKKDVEENENLYSIVYVENPVIVPGGRFREFYYWDSYWVIRGLLLSEMYHTTKGMLENFVSIVKRFGFIPNGGRVYYQRSQPPLFAPMVKTYVDTTKDVEFAVGVVDILAIEFDHWMKHHLIEVKGHKLARYGDQSSGPRPESYREDIETGRSFRTEEEKEEHYAELRAGAESGMDFSSRWFIDENGTNSGTLENLKTRYIVPVELNAILHWNAKIIAEFYGYAGNDTKRDEFLTIAKQFLDAVNDVLWDEETGAWLDYDTINNKHRPYFTPTNLSPLWMRCYDPTKREHIIEKVLDYINNTKLDDYPGGVPTTMLNSGEQWDWPNVWAPMQHILIVGLDNLGDERTQKLAESWAQRWVLGNYLAYKDTGAMYEKYLATELGGHGGGGEYEVQTGFGWTNGVLFDLFNRYGSSLTSSAKSAKPSTVSLVMTGAVGLLSMMLNTIRG